MQKSPFPSRQGHKWTTYHAKIEEFIRSIEFFIDQYGLFHLVMADPPYHLESIAKRFGSATSSPAKAGVDGAFSRASAGFMGQIWDGVDNEGVGIAHRPETWAGIARLLHPGGFMVLSHAPRTQHKLAHALAEAGLEFEPIYYNYATGCLETMPSQLAWLKGDSRGMGTVVEGHGREWDGYQYGAPLKPLVEPILVVRKPHDEKSTIANLLKTGAGGYNFNGVKPFMTNGRMPGNQLLTHHPTCQRIGFKPVYVGKNGIYRGGTTKTVYGEFKGLAESVDGVADADGYEYRWTYDCHADCHVAAMGEEQARFFTQIDYWHEQTWSDEVARRVSEADPIFYHGSVGATERNIGCDHLPTQTRQRVNPGGLEHDPKFAPTHHHKNHHPTLKPMMMWHYFAKLFCPPAKFKPQAFVPFAGTGSEMGACLLAGFERVVGVEMTAEYLPINQARLEFVEAKSQEIDYFETFKLTKEFLLSQPQQARLL